MSDQLALYERYQRYLCTSAATGIMVDVSRVRFDEGWFARMSGPIDAAFAAMDELERGAIANPDEGRMVGHYWLRDPALAPTPEMRREIVETTAKIRAFTSDVHEGRVVAEDGKKFTNLLVIGIGGSALGPELVAAALASTRDRMRPFFFDNTDPDGMNLTLARIGDGLASTLTIVISKSGGTKETRNGMLTAAEAYRRRGLSFGRHAVAITGEGSELARVAAQEGFIASFPMWDWVGGRTSELSAVGLVPAALQGVDIENMLAGARDADVATRVHDARKNPAALLALMWHWLCEGRGTKDMVVLPYKDRLELFSRYLQQLVMESLGKEKDLSGKVVHQGIAVYGNKGSTDQHAYVQQLRDGVSNFFVTFIEVLEDVSAASDGPPPIEVEAGVTAGDYLAGFLLGTRRALYENGRDSITITLPDTSPRTLGALIALYERAVGLYAHLVGINAYHQPGVEAGKKAASEVIALQRKVMAALEGSTSPLSVEGVARAAGAPAEAETVFKILEHLAANPGERPGRRVRRVSGATTASAAPTPPTPATAKYHLS